MKQRLKTNKSKRAKNKASDDILKTKRLVRVSRHRHTGRYLPLQYTSYALLFFVIIFTGILLFFVRQSIVSAGGPPQTLNGNISVSGVVPGPPPTIPAVITDPAEGQHIGEQTYVLKGTCEAGRFIEIYRNDASAGLVTCSVSGDFQINITLLAGKNKLVARTFDSIAQYGPDSAIVHVFYDVPSVDTLIATKNMSKSQAERLHEEIIGKPLVIYSDPVQGGFIAGGNTKLPYQINGGSPAYAVAINWGDNSNNSLESKSDDGKYTVAHRYAGAGQYEVTITASDTLGQQSTTQVILIVSGNKSDLAALTNKSACAINSTAPNCTVQNQILNKLDYVWPAIVGSGFMAISFWLGERVVYVRLASRMPKRT